MGFFEKLKKWVDEEESSDDAPQKEEPDLDEQRINDLLQKVHELKDRYLELFRHKFPYDVKGGFGCIYINDDVFYFTAGETRLREIIEEIEQIIAEKEVKIAKREAEILKKRDEYWEKYSALEERIKAVGGKIKYKRKSVKVTLPRRRKLGYRVLGMYFNDYDYTYFCYKLAKVEAVHQERLRYLNENSTNTD